MIPVFSGRTANDVWRQAAIKLLGSNSGTSESRLGKTNEILHAVFSIDNPKQRWVICRNPPISIAFALAEVVWILNGSNEAQVINYWNSALSRHAGSGKTYHGAYGYRIRKKFGIDQLERAYHVLKNDPQSRQTIIMIWDPIEDLPDKFGKPVDPDIPCNICSMLKVRDSKLEWTQIIRSNDIFLGVPYNFIQYTTLQEILAGWLEIDVGSYTQLSDSLHLYQKDEETLSIVEMGDAENPDDLILEKPHSDTIFEDIYNRMKIISSQDISKDELVKLAYLDSGYAAYDNIMLIIAAYAAKKMKYQDLKSRFTDSCTNGLFRQLWVNWENWSMKKRGM